MTQCPNSSKLQSYHDSELPWDQMALMEVHLRSCQACRKEHASFTDMSEMFSQAALPELRPLVLAQMHQQLDLSINELQKQTAEQGPLQLAKWLTAVAAVVLVVCSIQLIFLQSSQSAGASAFDVTPGLAWETTTAMLNQQNPADLAASDEHTLAAWIVSDLSASAVTTAAQSTQE